MRTQEETKKWARTPQLLLEVTRNSFTAWREEGLCFRGRQTKAISQGGLVKGLLSQLAF